MMSEGISPVVTACAERIVRLACWMFKCEKAVAETRDESVVIRVRAVSPRRFEPPAPPAPRAEQANLF